MLTPFIGNSRSVVVVILGILELIAGYAAAILVQERLYTGLIVPGLAGIALITCPIYVLPKILRFRDTPAISTFLRMMRDPVAHMAPHDDVRCSIFRLSLFKKRLIEVVICTVSGLERRKNKHMKVSQGVAGRAYRRRETTYIPIIGNWKEQLMRDFGFTEKEVGRFKPNRGSYLSIPILKGGNHDVVAVISLDSNSDGTFTTEMIAEIEKIAAYIARFAHFRRQIRDLISGGQKRGDFGQN